MRLTTRLRAVPAAVLALATLATLATAGRAGAQEAARDVPATSPMPGTPAVQRTPIAAVPPMTRVRLVTVGLPPQAGTSVNTSPNQRLLVGHLVRIDSLPSLSYVLRSEQGEWSVPRSSIASASRHVGTTSARGGVRRSVIGGVFVGSLSAFLSGHAAPSSEVNWGRRFPMHMAIGGTLGYLIARNDARDMWEELALPMP